MDPSFLSETAKILASTGPWGIVVGLAWAFWRVSSRKEDEVKRLYERLAELATAQNAAMFRMERAMHELRDTITIAFIRAKISSPAPNPLSIPPNNEPKKKYR